MTIIGIADLGKSPVTAASNPPDEADRRTMLQVAASSQFGCGKTRNLIARKGDKIIFSGVWFAYDKPNLRLLEGMDFDNLEWVDWQ